MSTFLIIGAGIAGPTAAIRLAQDGHRCTIFERSAQPHTIGGAVNLAPNGVRLLSRLGVSDIKKRGCTVQSFELRDERGGILGYVDNRSKDGFAGIRIMRSVLQEELLREARHQGVEVVFGKAFQSVREDSDEKVIATFKDGSIAKGDFLIGADGIHSTVREYILNGRELKPRYTGQSLVYGILPTKYVAGVDYAAMHATFGVFARKGFFAAAFTDETRQALYWIAARSEAVVGKKDNPEQIRSEELERFKDLYEPIPQIISATDEFFSWPVYELPEMDNWSRGRVVLVGDAAHALPPNRGQGVSQAIEDIFLLGRVISKGLSLRRYEELRKPRIAKLRATIQGQRREQERGPWAQWFRCWAVWAGLQAMRVLGWVWEYDYFAYDPDTVDVGF